LLAYFIRRLLARGDLPPIDAELEKHILKRAGLYEASEPMPHPGDLSRRIHGTASLPKAAAIRSALRKRDDFSPDLTSRLPSGEPLLHEDAETPLIRDWAPSILGPAAQWWHFQPLLDQLQASGEVTGTRADFLVASPDFSGVVEVDGSQHGSTQAQDRERDARLAKAGFPTFRVPAAEARTGKGPALDKVQEAHPPLAEADAGAEFFVWAPVIAQRVLLALAEAIDRGWLHGSRWDIEVLEPEGIGLDALKSAVEIVIAVCAIWDLAELPGEIHAKVAGEAFMLRVESDGILTTAAAAQAEPPEPTQAVRLLIEPFRGPYHELPVPHGRQVVVRSTYLPLDLVDPRLPGGLRQHTASAAAIPRWALVRMLRALFAKRDFLPENPSPAAQDVALRRLLAGKDTVVLLPTGAGKSMIFQLAGLLMPGMTLVIDPIVALIEDQLDGLHAQGIDRALGITSADTRAGTADEKLRQIGAGEVLFAFVAPERVQQQRFRDQIRQMTLATPVNLLVVDEAHCVSEWGHDFRTAYLDIGRVLRHVTSDEAGLPPPLLALTGTASRAVLKDMMIELSVDRADPDLVITPDHFDRPELRFSVVTAEDEDVINRVIGTLRSLPSRFADRSIPRSTVDFFKSRAENTACGVIFCPTVNGSPVGVTRLSQALEKELHFPVPVYAGKSPKGRDPGRYQTEKQRAAEEFKRNKVPLLVATKSYGMGIDKPNIRYVIHVGIPSSIEGYYQEAGRAGRDRRESQCVIIHHPKGRVTQDWFHGKTFRGAAAEAKAFDETLDLCNLRNGATAVAIPFDRLQERERAIHRLKLLGVVRDYTVDWSARHFHVRLLQPELNEVDAALAAFVRRNQPGRVPEFERRMAAEQPPSLLKRLRSRGRMMIDYVYETIVAARRRSVDEMEQLADDGKSDAIIRDRILRYLSLGKVALAIEEIVDAEPFRFETWTALLGEVVGADEAREWRGATARFLASTPDHPGLLLGRGLAEAAVPSGNSTLFVDSLAQSFRAARDKYSVSATALEGLVGWVFEWLGSRRPAWRALIFEAAERGCPVDAEGILARLENTALSGRSPDVQLLAVVLSRRLERICDRLSPITASMEMPA
jgi:ATP-dependent DNA helicase RecQ